MENKQNSYIAIAALVCYVLPFFLTPFLFGMELKDINQIGVVVVIFGSLSIILSLFAIIKHKRGEDSGWRSSIRRIIAVLAFCIAPYFVPFLSPLIYLLFNTEVTAMIVFSGFVIASGILAITLAISGIRNWQLKGRTLAIIVLLPALLEIGLGLLATIFTHNQSCGPFVYSFDGKEFVFDSEPYAGAILVERTCYTELNELNSAERQCQIIMINELDETHYTDELKLLVVEHPIGTDAVCDVSGGIYAISSPFAPISAIEQPNIDIFTQLNEKDDIFWEGAQLTGCQSELIVEFPKPLKAKEAKLVTNVSNTLWSSALSSKFLKSCGAWYPMMSAVRSQARKGFIRFEVQAWENDRWVSKAYVRGASPHLPKDQIAVLDVSEIQGERLKLRLLPVSGFWRINNVAVDYTDNIPVDITELEATKAITRDGKDIRETLRADDGDAYILENGEYTTITFEELPLTSGMEHSFILKATGYYVVH